MERGYKPDDSVVTCISLTSSQLLMDQTSRTAQQLAGTFSAALSTAFAKRAANLSVRLNPANCIVIDHFSAFEPGLVAPFLYAA